MFNDVMSKSYVNSGSVSQLSEVVALPNQAAICADGSDVSLISPQSSVISSGTERLGFSVSGTTVIVCVLVVLLPQASLAVHVTVMVYVAGAQMFNDVMSKSYVNSGSVSQLSEAEALPNQALI